MTASLNPKFGYYLIFPDMTGYSRYYTTAVLGSGWWVLSKEPPINARKKLDIWLTTSKNRDDILYAQTYPEIPKNKKDA